MPETCFTSQNCNYTKHNPWASRPSHPQHKCTDETNQRKLFHSNFMASLVQFNDTLTGFIFSRKSILKTFISHKMHNNTYRPHGRTTRSAALAFIGSFLFSGATLGITELQIQNIKNI